MSEIPIPEAQISAAPPPPAAPLRPHRGTAVLVLGIIGLATLITCYGLPSPIFGIIAWVMGTHDLSDMERGNMDPSGRNNTNAGRICGIVATITGFVVIFIAIAVIALIAIFSPESFKD